MLREMLKSKIYKATITQAVIDYEGSIAICPKLREAADLTYGEKVLVANMNTGQRLETYVLDGNDGEICLNGAAARQGAVGDPVIIMCFAHMTDDEVQSYKPLVVRVDGQNRILA